MPGLFSPEVVAPESRDAPAQFNTSTGNIVSPHVLTPGSDVAAGTAMSRTPRRGVPQPRVEPAHCDADHDDSAAGAPIHQLPSASLQQRRKSRCADPCGSSTPRQHDTAARGSVRTAPPNRHRPAVDAAVGVPAAPPKQQEPHQVLDVMQVVVGYIGVEHDAGIRTLLELRCASRKWREAISNHAAAEVVENDRYSRDDVDEDEDDFPRHGRLPYGHHDDDADPRGAGDGVKPLRRLDLVFNFMLRTRVPVHTLLLVLARGCNEAHTAMLRRISTLRVRFCEGAGARAFEKLARALRNHDAAAGDEAEGTPVLSAVRRFVFAHEPECGGIPDDVSGLLDALGCAEKLRAVTVEQSPTPICLWLLLRQCPRLRFLKVTQGTPFAHETFVPSETLLEHLDIRPTSGSALLRLLRACPRLQRLKVAAACRTNLLHDLEVAAQLGYCPMLREIDVAEPLDRVFAERLLAALPGVTVRHAFDGSDRDGLGPNALGPASCRSICVDASQPLPRPCRAVLQQLVAVTSISLTLPRFSVADLNAIARCRAPLKELKLFARELTVHSELLAAANSAVAAHAQKLQVLGTNLPVRDALAGCVALATPPTSTPSGLPFDGYHAVLECFKANPAATFPQLRCLNLSFLLRAARGDTTLVERFIAQQGGDAAAMPTLRGSVRTLVLPPLIECGDVPCELVLAAARCCPKTVSLVILGDIPATTFRALLRVLPELEDLSFGHTNPAKVRPVLQVLAEPWAPQLATVRTRRYASEILTALCAELRSGVTNNTET